MPAVKLIVFSAIIETPFLGVDCTGLLPAFCFAAFYGDVAQGIQWSGSVEASVLTVMLPSQSIIGPGLQNLREF
jgi:hypothetical protein